MFTYMPTYFYGNTSSENNIPESFHLRFWRPSIGNGATEIIGLI